MGAAINKYGWETPEAKKFYSLYLWAEATGRYTLPNNWQKFQETRRIK